MTLRNMRRGRRGQAGFSLTEVVISSVLLMVMAISVLPLFTKAAASNEMGRTSSELSNLVRTRAEELRQLPFDATALTIAAGTELVTEEQYSARTRTWVVDKVLPAGDRPLWLRRTTIRQYGVANLERLDAPLPAGTPAEGIHVKEILVEVRGGTASTLLGPTKGLTIRMLKSV